MIPIGSVRGGPSLVSNKFGVGILPSHLTVPNQGSELTTYCSRRRRYS